MAIAAVTPRLWFWVGAALALAWSLVGVASFMMDVMMTREQLEALPKEQQEVYARRPAWIVAVYAIAVFSALAGAIALLLRRRVAATLLAASLAAVVVQFLATLFVFGAVSTLGWSAAVFPAVIVLAGIAMLQLAKSAAGRGWIV